MRPLVIAFILGAVAIGIVAAAAGLAVGIVAQSGGWSSFRLGVGPIVFLSFERTAHATSTTFGGGLPLLALTGGLLNALGAGLVSRRHG